MEPSSTGQTKEKKKKRGRVKIARIEDKTSRHTSFSKRKSGLFKKAFELAVLCDAEVALLVFSAAGRLYEFSSCSSIEKTMKRYQQVSCPKKEATDENDGRTCSSSDLKSLLLEISYWANQENLEQLKVDELAKMEKILLDALSMTKSRTAVSLLLRYKLHLKMSFCWSVIRIIYIYTFLYVIIPDQLLIKSGTDLREIFTLFVISSTYFFYQVQLNSSMALNLVDFSSYILLGTCQTSALSRLLFFLFNSFRVYNRAEDLHKDRIKERR
ncbi:MADS-box transcription factor [Rhynchospora pubera]|uniref:MADS-box transcription factor n=1 Tax=Rhynchospora pubera TaxID=906938 RepID=A0AAV8C1Q1_9POAL|nr:MADS-box transcription factor [Rhynchospora pubera]